MEEKKKNSFAVIKKIFLFLLISVCLYFIIGENILPKNAPQNGIAYEEFVADWIWIKEDGSRVPVDLPGQCEAKRNEIVTVETTLPDTLGHDACLCIRSAKQEMEVYVDGVLREEYSTKNSRLFGKNSSVAYLFLELTPEDSGKTITIKTQTNTDYTGFFYPFYLGNKVGIWYSFVKRFGTELLVAFITLLLGLATVIGGSILRIFWYKSNDLEYQGWGVLLAAIWLITNSPFRQIMAPNLSVISDIPFFMIMLLPIPFLLYMNSVQKGRYKKGYLLMCIVNIVDFVGCTLLYVAGCVDFADSIIVMAGICILSIVFLSVTVILDVKNKQVKEYRWVAVGLLGACMAATVQILLYFVKTITFSGTMMALGLMFMLFTAVINTIRNILDIEKEKQKAVSASASKAKFLANMSHEIRTPINAVLGMNSMILRESKELGIREYALDIQNAGQSLLALINDILDFSKIESGKMEVISAEYDFSSMIHDISNMVLMKAQKKELQLNVHVNCQLPSRLWGDEMRLRQILINLLNNAVKYTHEGSVTLDIDGTVNGDTVLLTFSVEDTGIGIKPEDISKLFKEFERIEEERNRNIEGTGLGMSITVQLLELMGSKLQVESEYGKGSKFFFGLSQRIVNPEPIGELEERIRQQTLEYNYQVLFTAPGAQVLVVDDNAVNRKVFINLVKSTKVNVEEASDGFQCLEKVCQKHYDLIFMDHMMPNMDGIETLHKMQEMEGYLCKGTPVVALTANAISGAKEMYLSEGFEGFLSKPIMPEKLEKMMKELLPEEKIQLVKQEAGDFEGLSPVAEENSKQEDIELPYIEGMEVSYALSHLKDKQVLLDTIKDFFYAMDSEADYLEECYVNLFQNQTENREQTLELYRIKVHAMKSSASLIGILPLFGVARLLEYAARDEKYDVIEAVTAPFLQEWRGYKEKLAVCIPEEGEKKEIEDASIILAYLEMLRLSMEEMDVEAADKLIEDIRQYEYEPQIQEKVECLSVAVTNLDGEQVTELVEEISQQIQNKIPGRN